MNTDNKQETILSLMETINTLQTQLKDAQDKLETLQKYNWVPQKGETYYLVSDTFEVGEKDYHEDFTDILLLQANNVFKYRDQALKFVRRIKIERQLLLIAERLNNNCITDWKDKEQKKYFIKWDYESYSPKLDYTTTEKYQGIIYCLNPALLQCVMKEVDTDELYSYLQDINGIIVE